MPETSLADLGARLRPPGRSLADLLMTESLLPAEPVPLDPVTRATLGGDPWTGVQQRVLGDTSLSPINMAIGLIGGPSLRGAGFRPGTTATRPAANAPPEIPPPLSLTERNWQNYGRDMKPDDVLSSEAVWGGARRMAEETGVPMTQAFAQLANDLWRRMGANRYITPDIAKREMGKQRGIAAVGETKGGRLIGGPALKGIRAWHASPHRFDKFDLSKIGTGEGAQSYGHGLYFAENPKVSGLGGQYWQSFGQQFIRNNDAEGLATLALTRVGGDRAKALQYLRENRALQENYPNQYPQAMRMLESDKPVGPSVYEVNIRANPEQFLDWDRPLSGQPQQVQDFSKRYLYGSPEKMTGQDAYRGVSAIERPDDVSKALREAGIPGIKYLDQGSRGSGTGTSNYVLFDDSIIDILKRYGLVGGAAAVPVLSTDAQAQDDWNAAKARLSMSNRQREKSKAQ